MLRPHDMAGAEIVAIGLDHQLAVGGAGGGCDQLRLAIAGRGVVEGEPRMGHGCGSIAITLPSAPT